MKPLQGRVAVVTGSSRGIGKAIALCLADEGCQVVINFRSSVDAAHAAAFEIESRNPGSTCVIQADVTRESDIAAMTRIERDTADDSGTFSLLIVEPTRSTCSLALLVSFGGALLA